MTKTSPRAIKLKKRPPRRLKRTPKMLQLKNLQMSHQFHLMKTCREKSITKRNNTITGQLIIKKSSLANGARSMKRTLLSGF